jgi:hypothetical protein
MPRRAATLLFPLFATSLAAQNLLGLSADNRLLPLQLGTTLTAGPAIPITGLPSGASIVGIDVRPATGAVYGLGSHGQLYVIDPNTGAATAVGAPLTTALQGAEFGFDFNPTVDRIRVVSDSGQNLRLHPDTGAVVAVDGALQFAAGDPNVGIAPQVAASGYTNSIAGAVSTTLYGIDTGRDALVTQIPPNSGTLNTIGSLGRDVTAVAGFDILPDGRAFAALHTAGSSNGTTQLFAVDLTTGATSWLGALANANPGARLRGLAALPPRPDAELVALTADGRLARFDRSAPWSAPGIATLSGLAAGEELLGIDFRPATGQLYGLGSTSRLYGIDPQTGVATAIGTGFASPLVGTRFGFDFNPTVDRIRIVSDQGQNLRAHPDTGAVVATDGMLAYATGDAGFGMTPAVAAAAYTNDLAGATSTLLYGIDSARDVLVTQVPPNNGTLNTIGALGLDVTGVDGFDIGSDGRAFVALQSSGRQPPLRRRSRDRRPEPARRPGPGPRQPDPRPRRASRRRTERLRHRDRRLRRPGLARRRRDAVRRQPAVRVALPPRPGQRARLLRAVAGAGEFAGRLRRSASMARRQHGRGDADAHPRCRRHRRTGDAVAGCVVRPRPLVPVDRRRCLRADGARRLGRAAHHRAVRRQRGGHAAGQRGRLSRRCSNSLPIGCAGVRSSTCCTRRRASANRCRRGSIM